VAWTTGAPDVGTPL